jgi:spermidine synthase
VLLGFAIGGIVAPLRAMGWPHRLHAVDRSLDLVPLFRDVAGEWAGEVRVVKADAAAWLRRSRTPWDVVVEDLTVRGTACAIKPALCVDVLPQLVRDRLAPRGVVAINVLPVPGLGWSELLDRLAAPHGAALVVDPEEYENRVLLAGPGVPAARTAGRQLRAALRRIHSRQADRFTVQSW